MWQYINEKMKNDNRLLQAHPTNCVGVDGLERKKTKSLVKGLVFDFSFFV